MKRIILISFISLIMSVSSFAQVDEKIGNLIPYPDYIEAIKNRWKGATCILVSFMPDYPPALSTVSVIPFRLSNNKQVTAIIARGFRRDLIFSDANQQFQANLLVVGRIISADRKIDGAFEDKLVFNSSLEELKRPLEGEIFYRKIVDLPKGKYKLLFTDEGMEFGWEKRREFKFVVP